MNRTPGQRAGLDAGTVLRAALELLESGGVDAISMRRLADRLGVLPNAIYSHIPDRMSVLDGLLDLVLAQVRPPARGDGLARVELLMRRIWLELKRHPDLAPHLFSRQQLGPHALRLGHLTATWLAGAGLPADRAGQAMRVLMIYVIGAAAAELPPPASRPGTGRASTATFEAGLRWLLAGIATEIS